MKILIRIGKKQQASVFLSKQLSASVRPSLPSLKRGEKFNLKIPTDDITAIRKPSVIFCYLRAKI